MFQEHIFLVILQNFSSFFSFNQLVRFICTVQVITLRDIDGSVAELFRPLTFSLGVFARRVRYHDVALVFLFFFGFFLFLFSFSYIICIRFLSVRCFNIIIKTFYFNITEWGDTRVHVFIKHILVTRLWSQWMKVIYTNLYLSCV